MSPQVPEGAPVPGDLFGGKYRVERVLGVGGMGYVLAATHVHLHERVAIKILLPDLVSDRDTVERFLREGRAAVKIQSPHVARVKDVGTLPDRTPYIVMEYLDGADLGVVLDQQGKIPFALAVDYVLEACEAIAEAHGMNTVHRDLKPSNLFLTRMPNGATCVKVLDFGISKMNTGEAGAINMTTTLAVMGSPAYMSPEQLKASRSVDPRADIWSIGVVLHELISGVLPFNAPSVAELTVQILSEEARWLADLVPEVPPALAGLIATCLRKKPEERFRDLADLADALAPFGSAAARRSAERIVQTLGMPPTRAMTIVEPPSSPAASRAAVAYANTVSSGAQPVQGPRRKSATAFVAVFALLVLAGAAAGGFALRHRRQATPLDAPLASRAIASEASSAPPAVASAEGSSASGDPAPPPTGVDKAPPAPSTRPGAAARPSARAAPSLRPSSATQPERPPAAPASPAGIATSSKD